MAYDWTGARTRRMRFAKAAITLLAVALLAKFFR